MRFLLFPMKCVLVSGYLLLGLWGCSDDGDNGTGPAGVSGVDRNKYIDELTAEEATQLCNWSVPNEGGPGEYSCENANTGTIYTVEQCVASASTAQAHCLVSLAEDCVLGINGDPCQLLVTTQCKTYVACVGSSRGATQ